MDFSKFMTWMFSLPLHLPDAIDPASNWNKNKLFLQLSKPRPIWLTKVFIIELIKRSFWQSKKERKNGANEVNFFIWNKTIHLLCILSFRIWAYFLFSLLFQLNCKAVYIFIEVYIPVYCFRSTKKRKDRKREEKK